jgi:hypothetical protein
MFSTDDWFECKEVILSKDGLSGAISGGKCRPVPISAWVGIQASENARRIIDSRIAPVICAAMA